MSKPKAPDRWGGKNYMPVGRGRTAWGYPRVHPDDREFWEWLPQSDERKPLEAWATDVVASLPSLPAPSILYDLSCAMHGAESPADEQISWDLFWELVSDLHGCTLRALRRTLGPEDWIYATSEPEADYSHCYRFWPHRASEDSSWYVSPVPDGDHQFFASQDFQWGILSLFWEGDADWALCVFGEPLINAFTAEEPRAFSHRISDLRAG